MQNLPIFHSVQLTLLHVLCFNYQTCTGCLKKRGTKNENPTKPIFFGRMKQKSQRSLQIIVTIWVQSDKFISLSVCFLHKMTQVLSIFSRHIFIHYLWKSDNAKDAIKIHLKLQNKHFFYLRDQMKNSR